MKQLFAGFLTEGVTDSRFLEAIVRKTLNKIAFECKGQIDIELFELPKQKEASFIEQILEASQIGFSDFGMMMLCVHADADSENSRDTYENKINPAIAELAKQDEHRFCKVLVAIVPVQETEAWLLADKDLLKREIGTNKSDRELGISRQPENMSNPKEIIQNAIRIAREGLTKRRRQELDISELYLPIGQTIDLNQLERLVSFQDFEENVRTAFRKLNLL